MARDSANRVFAVVAYRYMALEAETGVSFPFREGGHYLHHRHQTKAPYLVHRRHGLTYRRLGEDLDYRRITPGGESCVEANAGTVGAA
jgi:hypothetical protein